MSLCSVRIGSRWKHTRWSWLTPDAAWQKLPKSQDFKVAVSQYVVLYQTLSLQRNQSGHIQNDNKKNNDNEDFNLANLNLEMFSFFICLVWLFFQYPNSSFTFPHLHQLEVEKAKLNLSQSNSTSRLVQLPLSPFVLMRQTTKVEILNRLECVWKRRFYRLFQEEEKL